MIAKACRGGSSKRFRGGDVVPTGDRQRGRGKGFGFRKKRTKFENEHYKDISPPRVLGPGHRIVIPNPHLTGKSSLRNGSPNKKKKISKEIYGWGKPSLKLTGDQTHPHPVPRT